MYKRKPQSASVLISLCFIALLLSVGHSKYSDTGDLPEICLDQVRIISAFHQTATNVFSHLKATDSDNPKHVAYS